MHYECAIILLGKLELLGYLEEAQIFLESKAKALSKIVTF